MLQIWHQFLKETKAGLEMPQGRPLVENGGDCS